MRRMLIALAACYRRWKYVEDAAVPVAPPHAVPESGTGERLRLRRAIEREEKQAADYRRNGCPALARERETTLRSLRTRLSGLEL